MRFILAIFLTTAVHAHSFYPWECCSDQDCWPLPVEQEPKIDGQDYVLHDGTRVPLKSTRPSPDGLYHVCRQGGRQDGAVIRPTDKPPCLWAPTGMF